MNDFEIIEQQVMQVNEDIKTFKSGLANALNIKGVPTSAKDSTVQIIANISKIEGGGSGGELVSGTKIPSDMLIAPVPNRTINNQSESSMNGNDYETWGSAWLEDEQAFLVFGENYGMNASIVKIDGSSVKRYDFPNANYLAFDSIGKKILIGYNNKSFAIANLQGVIEHTVNYETNLEEESKSYAVNIVSIRRSGDNYYILTGTMTNYIETYLFKTDLSGNIVKTKQVGKDIIVDLGRQAVCRRLNIIDNKIILKTMNDLFVLNFDLEVVKSIIDAGYTYDKAQQQVFTYGNYYLIQYGSSAQLMDKTTLEIIPQGLQDFYNPTFIYKVDETTFMIISNGTIRLIKMNGLSYTYEDKERVEIVNCTRMKDGNLLCEAGNAIIKFNTDFTQEWKVTTYGVPNWQSKFSEKDLYGSFVHEQGDYIYYVRKGAVLELDFVPSYTIK